MNREEAVDKAVEIVEKWSAPVMKSNGYAADGWKAPSLEEKVEAVQKLADFLWEPAPTTALPSAGHDA
jgi:hypothetical protein